VIEINILEQFLEDCKRQRFWYKGYYCWVLGKTEDKVFCQSIGISRNLNKFKRWYWLPDVPREMTIFEFNNVIANQDIHGEKYHPDTKTFEKKLK